MRLAASGFFILVLLLGTSAGIAAQSQPTGAAQGRIVGRVVAAGESGEPVAGASVTVRNAVDSTVAGGVMTADNGGFRIDGLPFGRYVVLLSHVGFAPQLVEDVTLAASAPETDLGTVRLEAAPIALEAIEAEAARSPVVMETDRTVYTAKDMPASSGGTATDLLRQVPELEVDINGNVALRGNQSVAIHLNGRPAPMRGEALTNFLQQMPADRIAKIEVMPNPSAKHDPEGTGGIVNLILKDDMDLGLSGNISLNGSSRGSRGTNARLAYQRGRLTFFGGGGLSLYDSRSTSSDMRQNLIADPVTLLEQQGTSSFDRSFRMLDLTTELKVGERTTAWITAMMYGGAGDNDASMLYDLFDQSRLLLDRYDRVTVAESDYGSTDFAIGFRHSITPQRHELTVDLRRNGYDNDGESYIEKLSRMELADPLLETRTTDNASDNRGLTLRADYTRPVGEKARIDVGLHAARRTLDDTNIQEVAVGGVTASERLESLYEHREDYQSAYLTVAQTFGNVGVQLGVRAELAATDFTLRSTGEQFDNDYRSVFPSLNLSYDAGEGRTVRLSYSKRISRPYAGLLNPYVPSNDPLNRSIGNPDLKPSYTHSFSLDFSKVGQKGTLRLAPYYRRTVDSWENIKRVDSLGVSTVTWENSSSIENVGATLTASLRPIGRLSGSATVGVYHSDVDASNISPEFSRSSVRWSSGMNLAARVTETMNFQASANYMPARQTPQGRISAILFSSIGLRQQLMDNKATVSLSIMDPFDLYEYTFETSDRTHVQSSRTAFRFRAASLSLTWNFGRAPEQKSRREGPEQADESVRIR